MRIGGDILNLFELFVVIGAKTSDAEKGIKDVGEKTESLGSKLKTGLASAAKIGFAAVSAAATGVAALTKASLDNYANYEQLVGGVETLFKDSADIVQDYAANAYKTAGLSANDYMETVTSFAASLLQSLDGDTAAASEKADMAITDMSDNANKMGTTMESIQNAYQGFAKQNYTMLDNLKLGYGGTKEEMERLLADAEKISGIEYDISSYADIVDAIHVVQTEMGITGTTALEASTTIQGSVSSAKAAWENLTTGIADENADLSGLIGEFVDSVAVAAENIIPRVTQILSGFGEAITQVAPVVAEQVPLMLSEALPPLLEAAISLVEGAANGLVEVLPDILNMALDVLPQLITAAGNIITNLAGALVEVAPMLLDSGLDLLEQLTDGILNGIPDMIDRIPKIIDEFLQYITKRLPDILKKGTEILKKLMNGIIQAIPQLVAALPKVISAFTEFVVQNLPLIVESGISLLLSLIDGIINSIPDLIDAIPQVIDAICQSIENLLPAVIDAGANIVNGVWEGIRSMGAWLGEKVSDFFSGIVDGVKELLGIQSPSKVFAGIGKNMALGLGEGFDDEFDPIQKKINGALDFSGVSSGLSVSMNSRGSVGGTGNVNVTQNIYGQKMTPAQVLQESLYLQKRAVILGV